MPKKKKTLKQKQQSDVRRKMYASDSPMEAASSPEAQTTSSTTFSLPSSYLKAKPHAPRKIAVSDVKILTHEYNYLGRDLWKTALLTGSIVLLEIIIRFIFERG